MDRLQTSPEVFFGFPYPNSAAQFLAAHSCQFFSVGLKMTILDLSTSRRDNSVDPVDEGCNVIYLLYSVLYKYDSRDRQSPYVLKRDQWIGSRGFAKITKVKFFT